MKKQMKIFLGAIAVLTIIQSCTQLSTKKSSGLMVGLAEVNYTPQVGLDLVGNYRGDDYASRGIHDSLYARAFVARGEDGVTAAILSIDICYVSEATTTYLREYIESETGIPAEHVMVLATHTHSGPESELSAPQAREYLTRAAGAAVLAYHNMAPSNLAAGKSLEDRVSFNRRLMARDGTIHMTWENMDPDKIASALGPKDPEVITFSVLQNGKEIGSVINFGCHSTTLTGDNWLYSADYPGYVIESIRRVKGGDYLPMFFNGPSGNVTQINPEYGTIYTFQEAQRIGYMVGISALEAIECQAALEGGAVKVSSEFVPLKRMTISEEQLAWAKIVMARVAIEGMPPFQTDGLPDAYYAKMWLQMHEKQDEVDSVEVQVIAVGELAFVALPSEPFNEFGVHIKKHSPSPYTMVMGTANTDVGYFPTKESYEQGPEGFTPMISGYETTPGSSNYEIGSGEALAESAIRQLEELF